MVVVLEMTVSEWFWWKHKQKPLGVKVQHSSKFEEFLMAKQPDAVIVTTMSLFRDCYDVLMTCAKCGVNAITTCEEAFYPMNS